MLTDIIHAIWLVSGWWFFLGIPGSSTNKTDRHDINIVEKCVKHHNPNPYPSIPSADMPVEKEIIDKIPTAGAEEIGAPLSGNIWKVMVLPHQKINVGKYGRKASWLVKRYGKYGRKASWIVKRYWKYGRKVWWIVKRYGKYKRKVSWIVKRYGHYGRKVSRIVKR